MADHMTRDVSNSPFMKTKNGTLDNMLGGGLLYSTLNIFELRGPTTRRLDDILERTVTSATITNGDNVIFINFNGLKDISERDFYSFLPVPRMARCSDVYRQPLKDLKSSRIKIAWRYAPSEGNMDSPGQQTQVIPQLDFGTCIANELSKPEGIVRVVDIASGCLADCFTPVNSAIDELKQRSRNASITIILHNLFHPLNPLFGDSKLVIGLLYSFRALARSIGKCTVVGFYDVGNARDYDSLKHHIHDTADCVVSFNGFESGESETNGYNGLDGIVHYIKAAKINTNHLPFPRYTCEFGYRLVEGNRYLMIDELTLGPEEANTQQVEAKKTSIDGERGREALGCMSMAHQLKPMRF